MNLNSRFLQLGTELSVVSSTTHAIKTQNATGNETCHCITTSCSSGAFTESLHFLSKQYFAWLSFSYAILFNIIVLVFHHLCFVSMHC